MGIIFSSFNGLEPKLRFPNFIEKWTRFEAENIFKNITDKNHPTDTVLTIQQGRGTLPRDLSGRNILYDNTNTKNYKRVQFGDFIIHLRSFEGGLEMANEQGIVSPAYTILRYIKPIAFGFYKAYFRTNEFINHILSKSVEGIRDGKQISYDAFKWLAIPYCQLEEQQKIADFLSLVDQRIEKQRQLVESLKKYKRGLLSAIFDKISSTSTLTLGEICNITTGKLDANAMVVGGKYRFYTCAREYFEIDTYAFDTDALLISGNGANVGYIHHYCGKFNAYQRTYVLDGFQENIMYIYYYLQANLHPRIEAEKKAGNTPYIVLSTLSDMLIKLPAKERQNNIAKIFAILDKKIMVENDVLERLNTQKQGLLQQMFI